LCVTRVLYPVCWVQERGLDVGAQAGWLASSFNQTAKEFYNKTTEASRRLALWGPLASYLDGVAEVFETSGGLGLSEEKLLSEGFDWLLPACRQSELHAALGFLQVVLSQLRYETLENALSLDSMCFLLLLLLLFKCLLLQTAGLGLHSLH